MADEAAPAIAVAKDRSRVLGGTYRTFYSEPLTVASARGCTITDANGEDYLDAYNNVPVLGHSSPAVRSAVSAELGRANSHTRYLDARVIDYARRLIDRFPAHFESVVFACSGSEANDLALRLAAHATGRDGVIVTRHAYHGTTSAVAAISPSLVGTEVGEHVEPIDLPAWDAADFDDLLAEAIAGAARRLEVRGHPLGAFILDSTVTSDGILEPRSLAATAGAVRSHGGLWIADEVQSGFGRTGADWGFQRLDLIPDLVTLGKPMGNGLPISAVLGPREIFDDFGAEQRYFNTFAGTAVPVAAAEVVLTALESGDLVARAQEGGRLLENLLIDAIESSATPALVRRNGLMVGIDFETGGITTESAVERAKEMVERLYAERILVSTTGRAGTVLKIRPPLVITDDELRELASGFARVLARGEAEAAHAGE